MSPQGILGIAGGWMLLVASCLNALAQDRHQVELDRPMALALDRDSRWIYMANSGTGDITAINPLDHSSCVSLTFAKSLLDLTAIPNTDWLLAVTRSPNRCLLLKCQDGELLLQTQLDLAIEPERLALSSDQQFVCISDRWNQKISVLECMVGDSPTLSIKSTLNVPLMPKEILPLENSIFCIADAFEGKLAMVDAKADSVSSIKRFQGHHIGGLVYDARAKRIWITHQILSRVAHSTRDDIHWGSLIQNVVRGISAEALASGKEDVGKNSILHSLGDVGKGAADPSGIVLWKNDLVIAASGANQLLRFNLTTAKTTSVDTPVYPTRIAMIGEERVAVVCQFSNAVAILGLRVDQPEGLQMQAVYGKVHEHLSPALAGEVAFHSGTLSHDRWMSCNSCHVDGHTPNLMADTLGDESFGAPKRIPSLLGNAETAPFGWYGNKPTLEQQILQTLASTMHAPHSEQERVQFAGELSAYLKTLDTPKRKMDEGSVVAGKELFESRGCSKCHQADNRFTSNNVYDVGVRDERGHREFNPPSLLGVGLRSKYLHDGRYESLRELLNHHPAKDSAWDEQEAIEIIRYLRQL